MYINCYLLVFVTFGITITLGVNRYDDYEFILEKCCDLGTNRAKQMPTGGCVFGNTTFDRLITNTEYRKQCELVVQICCLKEHRSRNCEEGKAFAKRHENCSAINTAIVTNAANETVKDCCLSCHLGLMASRDHFPCTFNAHGTFGLGYPYEDVYYECCANPKLDAFNSLISTRRSGASTSICDTNHSPCAHNCYDPGADVGPVRCSCFKGYQLATDGRDCIDVDECDEKTHTCDVKTEECVNNVGGFECRKNERHESRDTSHPCPDGYKWNNRHKRCSDIDECFVNSDNCNRLTHLCKNQLGSFQCILLGDTCPPGFKRGPNGDRDCQDINECLDRSQNGCQEPLESCINSVGGYYCEQIPDLDSSETTTRQLITDPTQCKTGYRFSKLTYQCEDIDECRIGQHTCNLATHNCVNTDGTYNYATDGRESAKTSTNARPSICRVVGNRAVVIQKTSETTSETPSETTAETDKPLKSSAEEVEGEEEDEDDSLLQASKGGDGDAVNMKTCGITRKKSGNIVGGEKAAEAEFPWIVSFQRPKGDGMIHFCGGSIINERWLLSAAHCFQGVTNSFPKMKAVVGTIKWADPKAPKYTLEKLFNHEAYDENVYANDISLIKVKETIAMTSTKTHYTVNSVCVPTPDVNPTDTATVYGWGYLKEEGDPSADLMKVTVNKFDTKECNKVYTEFVGNFTPEMFCYLSPGKDACKGDSGGPLTQTIKRKGTQLGVVSFGHGCARPKTPGNMNRKGTQLGVVSFGHGCARPKTPGIYQEVAKFYPWIEKTIKANP
ncbi:unnamed protein product [Medioppia subpectinata]|uniref:Peptidase S1 domain-containing protein n=1 Tax=Medioppia subpectinata TaxID=1979941 RepID=A0A7R9L036_9ACAR|nr:unnamed protein product [Medioppia subpectinata]CAG2111819.1 unnamed protein product [Medioppia subpectinata]